MTTVREAIPLLYRHKGRWQGEYIHIDNDVNIVDRHKVDILVEFPDENGVAYRQTSNFLWDDGRKQEFRFEAGLEGDRLKWDNGGLAGEIWAIDQWNLYLWFRFTDAPDDLVTETIYLSDCGKHRTRTWHWLRDGALYQRTLVNEARAD